MNIQLDNIKTLVLGAVGTIVIIILFVRIATAYGKKQWGEIVTELMAAVFVFYACFFTDAFVNTIKTIGQSVFGAAGAA